MYVSSTVETFLDVQLQVRGCPDLHASLQRQFSGEETLEGENEYDAGHAGYGRQEARRGVRFRTLPPVLNLHTPSPGSYRLRVVYGHCRQRAAGHTF